MRLIDADRFEDEMNEVLLPKLIKEYGKEEVLKGLHFSFRDCICNIQAQPTVDAVSREKYEAREETRKILVEFADDLLAELKERVEVVRCKDCKYFEPDLIPIPYFEGEGVCFHEHWTTEEVGFEVKEIDFCSYGERKNDD